VSLTYEEAVSEMFERFYAVWQADTVAVVASVPEVRWQGLESGVIPGFDTYWARVSQETVDEQQSTLRNGDCGQRYRTDGLLFVQIFCPKSDPQSMANGRKLATIAKNTFRSHTTPGGVWFRNPRVVELEPEEKWIRLNVIVQYQYDETF
jgi:hypothetical protein